VGDGGVLGAHAFRGFCLNSNPRDLDAQELGNMLLDGPGVWTDFRGGQDQGAINIPDDIARLLDLFHRLAHEDSRVSALPLGIAWRKICPYVAGGDRAKQGVGQGMQQHVSIGMAG